MSNLYDDFIIDHQIMKVFEKPIVLKSGALSQLYINWRQAGDSPHILDQTADFILEFCKNNGLTPDCFFGVPEGATKLGIITSYKWAAAHFKMKSNQGFIPMGRGKIKDHGDPKDRYYIGLPEGKKTIVIEDVTTTGNSLIQCIDQLLDDGIEVLAAITLTNRMADACALPQFFEDKYGGSCPFYALTSLGSLLNRWQERHSWTPGQKDTLAQEFPDLLQRSL